MIPVSIITGFLGSGKTTLLNHIVRQPGMADTAVIVNEFGEIGLDHLLIEQAFEDTVLLENGCICCSIRGDLVDTLIDLEHRVERGDLPAFSKTIVETTGLADPAPILQTLMSEPRLQQHYALERIVATVDAVNAAGQLDEFEECVKQIALADHLLLTKSDLSSPAAAAALKERVRAVNPSAPLSEIDHGKASPDILFGTGPGGERDLTAWLHHGHDHGGDTAINSFALTIDEPLPWEAVKSWLESIASLRGSDLLRVKGILNVAGRNGPVVVHGVQHVFHPPVELDAWPDETRTTRIVFITRNIEKIALENALSAFVARASAVA
ncbi:MAG: GTP-binding protein [Alphaproteobacteria bacterium]|nr:GTP-binding protein [Alphaproteobacteria bacterium]